MNIIPSSGLSFLVEFLRHAYSALTLRASAWQYFNKEPTHDNEEQN